MGRTATAIRQEYRERYGTYGQMLWRQFMWLVGIFTLLYLGLMIPGRSDIGEYVRDVVSVPPLLVAKTLGVGAVAAVLCTAWGRHTDRMYLRAGQMPPRNMAIHKRM